MESMGGDARGFHQNQRPTTSKYKYAGSISVNDKYLYKPYRYLSCTGCLRLCVVCLLTPNTGLISFLAFLENDPFQQNRDLRA